MEASKEERTWEWAQRPLELALLLCSCVRGGPRVTEVCRVDVMASSASAFCESAVLLRISDAGQGEGWCPRFRDRSPKHKSAEQHSQSHTAPKWQGQRLNPGDLVPEPELSASPQPHLPCALLPAVAFPGDPGLLCPAQGPTTGLG